MAIEWLHGHDLDIARSHLRERQRYESRPLFIFPCGGDEKAHASRKRFRQYISRSSDPQLSNVFCLTAEDVAKSDKLKHLNLLQQEAMLADMCDLILIFAESVGSYCELGSFSVLPHAAAVCAVAVNRKYELDESYLNLGPVGEIKELGFPLNRVFYIDLENPFADPAFSKYISELRKLVRRGESRSLLARRKAVNLHEDRVFVGALAHELIDLLHLFGPLSAHDLIRTYCLIKGFRQSKIRVISSTLSEDMKVKPKRPIQIDDVIEMLVATGLVGRSRGKAEASCLLSSTIHLDHYFMFVDDAASDFRNMRARVLLKRRSRAKGACRSVYRSTDID